MNDRELFARRSNTEEEINLLELLRVVVRNLPLIAKITPPRWLLSVVLFVDTEKRLHRQGDAAAAAEGFRRRGGRAARLDGGLAGLAGRGWDWEALPICTWGS